MSHQSSALRQALIDHNNPPPEGPLQYTMHESSTCRVKVAQAEIVLSNKGGPKLIHDGFMYTLHKKYRNNVRWRCVMRTTLCRGSLITSTDYKTPKARMQHNHPPDIKAASEARQRYFALGQPPVFPEIAASFAFRNSSSATRRIKAEVEDEEDEEEFYFGPPEVRMEETEVDRKHTHWKSHKVMQAGSQGTSGGRTIRIATQPLMRPQMRNIAPAPAVQQQYRQPKTLVLKTIPLKVKQVAPTTIKMAPRQQNTGAPQPPIPQQSTEVCLRWNSYHSNMQNSFPSLLDTEQFVDVTLACEGRSLKCHKMILSSCSDYLAALLRENPCQHPIILMKDLKFWEVEALVKFMYRGEVNVAHDKLPQLLNAAEALQVKGLAGPSPSLQNPRPPKLVPQSKPLNPSAPGPSTRVATEPKDSPKLSASSGTPAPPSPQRGTKRQSSEPPAPKPFTKIRLQRPITPTSPNPTVKLEPLDIPLSPTEIFHEQHDEDSSTASNFDNLVMALHEEDDPGGDDHCSTDGDINFSDIRGQPDDINDNEEQMEFVPTDFLEQEQDIVEDADGDCSKSSIDDTDDDEDDEIDDKNKPPDERRTAESLDDRGGNKKS